MVINVDSRREDRFCGHLILPCQGRGVGIGTRRRDRGEYKVDYLVSCLGDGRRVVFRLKSRFICFLVYILVLVIAAPNSCRLNNPTRWNTHHPRTCQAKHTRPTKSTMKSRYMKLSSTAMVYHLKLSLAAYGTKLCLSTRKVGMLFYFTHPEISVTNCTKGNAVLLLLPPHKTRQLAHHYLE